MSMHFIAGVVYLCAVTALSGASLDVKISAFEDAVKKTPAVKDDASPGIWPRGRETNLDDLDAALQRDPIDNYGPIEAIVTRLMTTHPSDAVQMAGQAVTRELENRLRERAQEYDTKANAVLAEASDAVTHAKTAADLDGILAKLHELQGTQNGYLGDAGRKIPTVFQFVTQWQNYLAAAQAGNWPEAQNNLRAILNNPQIDAPMIFPRSEILAKYEATFHGGVATPEQASVPAPGAAVTDPDVILAKVKKPADLETLLPQLQLIPPVPGFQPYDWSEFEALTRARDDTLAGFTVMLDLKRAMTWPDWGDQWSRITAMELLEILPHYFGTNVTAPPKENETIADYLDRLSNLANAAGNLALLQRVIAVKVALGTANSGSAFGTQQFLAGLSQDAGGQYAFAVVAYENALHFPDHFLPVEIVGQRLAAIKAAHPDEFEKGMATFNTPPSLDPSTLQNAPPWLQPAMRERLLYPHSDRISVLPIPTSITVPGKANVPNPTSGSPETPSETR